MATVNANPISTSCQSIASTGGPSAGSLGTIVIGGAAPAQQRSTTHYVNGTGSLGRLKYHNKHKSLDASDEELDYSQMSQSTHIIGRVRSERFLATKPDEDRRRRTIIIEKKNDSYGFTLQSYGIHYKKDQEVEMITYVDYVEYDGPAYKAGMREGDVILSINGSDMEKADHKTIVDFIKSCDTRMRMVVLFEDCVRKVDLHMRYIQLQNLLHSKMNELERICLRERELLEGKWKTHSLPARKKATTSPTDAESGTSPTDGENLPYYRPALSTEDVPSMARFQSQQQAIIPPPAQFTLTYHYLDPAYRYVMKPVTSNSSGEHLATSSCGIEGIQRSPSDQHFILRHTESVDTAAGLASLSHRSVLSQAQSGASAQAPVPPPRTCEKHKPPNKQHSVEQQHYQQQQQQQQHQQTTTPVMSQKSHKSSKHCYGHSCNPCIGHFRWKSAEKAAVTAAATMGGAGGMNVAGGNGNGNGDNISLDAYDLASPCCDAHCVPTRRRTRHKEHTHKHKHRDRERDSKERQPRPKSQTSHTSPGITRHHMHHHHHHTAQDMLQQLPQPQQQQQQQQQHHHHHHLSPQQQQQQQQQHQHLQQSQPQPQPHGNCDSHNGSMRSRYYDLTTGLMSHCSLHSCTSSEFAPADSTSYTTSLSTDTLYWDPKSEHSASRQHSTKSRQSYQQYPQQHAQQSQQQPHTQHHQQQQQPTAHVHGVYQQRYHITATQVQPSQIYPQATYVQKPKSWDNLTTKAVSGYGFGYGYLDTVTVKPAMKLQIAQQRHSIPRKNPYGRYSTYTDVENYAPPPSQFVEELITTTTTTKIMAKSTEELIAAPVPQTTCDCMTKQQQQALKAAQYQINQAAKVSHHNNCQMGYYSHLPRPTLDAGTSTVQTTTTGVSGDVATVSEVTRL